jgi:alkylation response protein AidB-like acyl-CoA dehydrogenase
MFLTEEELMIQASARAYVESKITPYSAEWDRQKTFPKSALQGLADLGFFGMLIPERWGGADIGYFASALVLEEIAVGDAACSTIISVTNSVVSMPLYRFGNEHQKSAYLQPLASGKKLGAFCLTEPHAGSDASDLRTKAIRHNNGYHLNGVKQFITSGKNADIALVFAVTDKKAGKKGISAFIVETDTPGYSVSGIENKMGQHASDTAQIVFEACWIPESHRLGDEGEGYKIALSGLEGGRIGIAAQCVGIARAALEHAMMYAKERKTFGKPLYHHQSIAFKLARMATQLEAARLMVHHAARLKDAQLPCLKEASMAKLFASEMGEKVCSDAMQILGGYGYLNDFPIERYYRDVRIAQIYEGTSEIQQWVISRAMMSESST